MPTAFETDLVEAIPELQRYAHKLTGERTAAEDLVQDCLERALANVEKFQPGTNLHAWLVTILKNIFFTERRRSQICPFCELGDNDRAVPPAQMWRVALHEVEEAMEDLAPERRGLVEMVVIDGVAYQDVAARLGIPVGTIRSRLSRVREQIRSNLERRQRLRRRRTAPVWTDAAVTAPRALPHASTLRALPVVLGRGRRPSGLPPLRPQ